MTMDSNTVTELVKLSYTVPKESNEKSNVYDEDFIRLMGGVAFPIDDVIDNAPKCSPQQKCKKCKSPDCNGVCI